MDDKFFVFVKDFLHGTEFIEMGIESYFQLIRDWNEGMDINVNNHIILNKNIESVYISKFR